jgi:nucleoside-diphosphate-sugar epimerase
MSTPVPATRQRERLALVIGATGAFGSHAAAALIGHGWRVRALARDPVAARAKAGPAMPIEWVKGDAMDAACVLAAAAGAQLIVHAANPPAYRNWRGTVLPMVESTIGAAKAVGARILLPGTVYNFAPGAGASIVEDAPQRPATRKGAIRAQLEARLRAASHEGARVLIVRAGDFFGAGEVNSALDWLVMRRAGAPAAIFRPGRGSVGHAFAYLPDLAETAARLLDREDELADFAMFHFAGQFLTLDELVAGIRRAAGRPRMPAVPFPWPLMRLMGLWDETMRELMEMRYLWRRPIGLSNARLVAFLGEEPRTPLLTALRESLAEAPQPVRGKSGYAKPSAGALAHTR